VVSSGAESVGNTVEIFRRSEPLGAKASKRERVTVTLKHLLARLRQEPFMEIRERELTRRTVDRVAKAQYGMISLTDSAEAASATVQRNHMIKVSLIHFG
jgi:hypothetical protein